jgi:hypothetical protein
MRYVASSDRCCFSSAFSARYESESRPNGFSTMTRVQPVADDAAADAAAAAAVNTEGGMDR